MLPNLLGSNTSSVSITDYRSRYESVTKTQLDQNPISTHRSDEVEDSSAVSRADNFNVDALVNQIWGFASARIAQAEADGASEEELDSLWQAAEKGVTQGFGEARDILDSMGELEDPLQLKIDSAFGQIMDKLDSRSLDDNAQSQIPPQDPTQPTQNVNRAISVYQYERQTFSLNLTTEQGDEILIRSVSENESSVDDLRFGRLSSTTWGNRQESGFSLVIKGDLNEQEKSDLDALLADVNELAAEFYEGDYETAFNMASDLNINGTSLRSMDLSMKEVEQKGAAVYAQTGDRPAHLPKGLEPLKQYAEKLMAAQDKWSDRFNSPRDFLNTLSHHPSNAGGLMETAKLLMM